MDEYIPLLVILAIVSYAAYLSIIINDQDDKKK
jgi:hypothetical protein